MSENDSSQEKTEDPTSRRLEKAREEGNVPRSKELTTTALLLLSVISLFMSGKIIADEFLRIMRVSFDVPRDLIFDPQKMLGILGTAFYEVLLVFLPFFAAVVFACIAGPVALGGFVWSSKALAPKLNRLDPIAGIKRIFSVKSLMELLKSIAKVLVVMLSTFFALTFFSDRIMGLVNMPIANAIAESATVSAIATIVICAATIFIAIMDVPFQIYDHNKNLKMSLQDVKDEMKDTEGKPEVKGRIRQLQREMAQKRMMADVPKADVIITNPTHYSVALIYDPNTMATPIVVAKGVDQIAMKIREIGKANNVEMLRAPALTRSIYHTTELGEEIPSGLYIAVAKVLAYIFQLREYRAGRGQKPDRPKAIHVPRDMYFD